MSDSRLTRRSLIVRGAGTAAALGLSGSLASQAWGRALGPPALSPGRRPWRQADQVSEALRVLGRNSLRMPDSLPAPALPAGTDTLPQIEHVVVLMLENHSYDNLFGMLGRGRGQAPRGDGFTLGSDGRPTATNPYPNGTLQRAFRMPTTCQLDGTPSQEWAASHNAFNNGAMDGFVRTPVSPGSAQIVGPVAMGYWTADDLPFTNSLASQFPIGDRWFCSCLAQTDPNRRYLIAATSTGMTDDIGTSPGSIVPDGTLGAPANGTIFDRLSAAQISWIDYCASFPSGATMELYPTNDSAFAQTNVRPLSQFFTDARAGTLPSFSLLDPDYGTQSQENPQNIVVGEGLLSEVVQALGASPAWRSSLLIVTYDEHGGYYDHVAPPVALAPDDIPPTVQPGESTYDGFARYGFRVPSIVVGPYAKPGYVSHVVYDHTSVLAFLERKWNLAAMTRRDANANDLTDFLDLAALSAAAPTFPELPRLAAPGDTPARLACTRTGPGAIPPPEAGGEGSGRPAHRRPPAIHVRLRDLGERRRLHGLLLELRTDHGYLRGLEVELRRGRRTVARGRVAQLGPREHRMILRAGRRAPARGRYAVLIRAHGRTLLRRELTVR
jgi:phospholipase C